MNFRSWLKWLGLIIAIAGVAAQPSFADLVPQLVASIAIVVGATASALSRGITNNTALTWVGVAVLIAGVFAEPTVAGIVGAKAAQFASLIGALLTAAGGAIPKQES